MFKTLKIVALVLMVSVFAGHATAGEYIGKACWSYPPSGQVELVITHLGNGHYLGSFFFIDTTEHRRLALGNGALIDERTLRFQLSSSDRTSSSELLLGMIGTMDIDLMTLNATARAVHFDCPDGATDCTLRNDDPEIFFTFIPCP